MLSFEPELRQFEGTERVQALERREVFSVYPELRFLSWAGVMLIVGGVGVLVSKNLDKVGPVALAAAIAVAAAACYAYAVWRKRSGRDSLVDDFVLLLGALLLSADLGYIESQFHLLDQGWPRHFLILAIVHGLTAYYFDSRTLLALSISGLAAWLRVEQPTAILFGSSTDAALRSFVCAALVAVWRFVNRRESFERIFDHAVAILLLSGSLTLTFGRDTRTVGTLITVVLAVLIILFGLRERAESFALYGYVAAVIAIDVFVVEAIDMEGETAVLAYLVLSTVAAIVGLFALHNQFRRLRAELA